MSDGKYNPPCRFCGNANPFMSHCDGCCLACGDRMQNLIRNPADWVQFVRYITSLRKVVDGVSRLHHIATAEANMFAKLNGLDSPSASVARSYAKYAWNILNGDDLSPDGGGADEPLSVEIPEGER